MPRRRFRGVRLPVDRLVRHLLHQGGDVQPADLDAFGGKQIAQHRATREREVYVQRVDPPHDREVGREVGLGG